MGKDFKTEKYHYRDVCSISATLAVLLYSVDPNCESNFCIISMPFNCFVFWTFMNSYVIDIMLCHYIVQLQNFR